MTKADSRSQHKITPEHVFQQRRRLLKQLMMLSLLPSHGLLAGPTKTNEALANPTNDSQLTPIKAASSYNNYYEFTDNKEMVRHLCQELDVSSWQLSIGGMVANPMTLNLQDLIAIQTEQRIYRMRCVEGWSMVVPWQGFELNYLLKLAQPTSAAKFVKFVGYHNPKVMIGQRKATMEWPYTEGLRLDEAMHPLTLLATGLYGKPLPKQNGAPLRLVVPWKYGYKSIKAVTHIELTDTQPLGSWHQVSPTEYGFYGNVNPNVAHPRWSQRREVRLGELKKTRTELLNGYASLLEDLYQQDDLNSLF